MQIMISSMKDMNLSVKRTFVTAVSKGSIEQIDVIEGGTGYKVGELVRFDQENTGGTGLSGEVSELVLVRISYHFLPNWKDMIMQLSSEITTDKYLHISEMVLILTTMM